MRLEMKGCTESSHVVAINYFVDAFSASIVDFVLQDAWIAVRICLSEKWPTAVIIMHTERFSIDQQICFPWIPTQIKLRNFTAYLKPYLPVRDRIQAESRSRINNLRNCNHDYCNPLWKIKTSNIKASDRLRFTRCKRGLKSSLL